MTNFKIIYHDLFQCLKFEMIVLNYWEERLARCIFSIEILKKKNLWDYLVNTSFSAKEPDPAMKIKM